MAGVGVLVAIWLLAGCTTPAVETIAYTNALKMQYTQPWLDAQQVKAAPAIHSSNEIGMLQYAQRWRDAQQVGIAPAIHFSNEIGTMANRIRFQDRLEGKRPLSK